ncbi:universal stress protein [Qipengyuania flava]|uniref:universal stress protein n=1 Tax=Qipengyuania flava TaxID=192812 RepID=UPI00141B62D7|nr:universal stress protein [Qipengyuania flava]NIJ61400.1 nucleotide-binding universal stress UspA family protein [Qipengyuania flava]
MKTILFNAADDDGFPGRLDAALDLARHFDAHLTLLHAMPYEAAATVDFHGAAFAALVPVWREEAAKLRERTLADLGNEGVSWNWVESAGPVALALLRESSLNDLVVVSARDASAAEGTPSFTAGELALTASSPVLVLPESCSRFDPAASALVAWDGSAEASHALRAAVPFLKSATAVYLATVKEDERRAKAHDLPPVNGADYLSRHGISCEMVELECSDGDVAKTLCDAAEVRKAGLLVMGAYGRTRLTERIFGGATRRMLCDVTIPLLMTH